MDGVVFTDSSYWQHPATVGGNTHTDTAVKKFGTASVQFDGTTGNDYLDFATTPQFGFGTGDWTVDLVDPYGSSSGAPVPVMLMALTSEPGVNSLGSARMYFLIQVTVIFQVILVLGLAALNASSNVAYGK